MSKLDKILTGCVFVIIYLVAVAAYPFVRIKNKISFKDYINYIFF